jgi:hypothetical protein
MARRPGGWGFVNKMVARYVVARIKAVEVAAHLCQFFLAVGGQRLDGFVTLA